MLLGVGSNAVWLVSAPLHIGSLSQTFCQVSGTFVSGMFFTLCLMPGLTFNTAHSDTLYVI